MRKKVTKAISSLLAGVVCLSAMYTGHAVYAGENEFTTVDVGTAGVSITGITDAAIQNGTVTIPDTLNDKSVVAIGSSSINHSIFNGKEVKKLVLGKNIRSSSTYALYNTPGLKQIEVADGNTTLTTDSSGVTLFAGSKNTYLIKLCPDVVSSYTVPDTVQNVWNMDHMTLESLDLNNVKLLNKLSLAGTEIGTLTIKDAETNAGTDILYGAIVNEFKADDSTVYETDGNALWTKNGKKLVKVAAGAEFTDDYFKQFSEVSPYAFNSIPEYLKIAKDLPKSATKNKVFSFYSQNDAVFIVNGEVGFCYNHDKVVPETVDGVTDYSKDIDTKKYEQIRALMYVGVPVDGAGIFEEVFGTSYEDAVADQEVIDHGDAALNTVSALVYNIIDNAEPNTIRGTGYGVFSEDKVKEYHDKLLKAVENYKDYNFEPNFSIDDNTVTFHRSGNGYESDPFIVNTVNASGTVSDKYVYTINITSDDVTCKDGSKTFHTGEEVTLVSDTKPTNISFSYNEPSLKYYRKTTNTVQDVLAATVNKKTAAINVKVDVVDFLISKQDITTNKELPGASLTLKKGAEVIDEWTSGTEPHKIVNLADGDYTLIEETAPDGYQVAESVNFTVTNGTVANGKVVMYDSPVTKDKEIYISKQDITTNKELPGASLTLKKGAEVIDEWTSGTEPHKIVNLADGDYTLIEETAPDGYQVAESVNFTVTNGTVANGKVVMYDSPVTKDKEIYISKQDITTNKELPGASLTLKKGAEVIDEWTSGTEPHKIVNLADGDYTLIEETAPDGYQVAESVNFTVTNGTVANGKVVMYDSPVTKDKEIYISKQDITNGKELSGAKLILTNEHGDEVDSWTSEKKPHTIKNLTDGTYVLTEVTAPNGYEIAESITFEVTNSAVKNGSVVMYDAPKKETTPSNPDKETTEFTISKRDVTNGKELPGAKLTLTDHDGNTVDSWTSTTTAHTIKNLTDGEYKLTEVTAPDGYEVAESITFTVANGTVTSGVVVMYDSPKKSTPDKEDKYFYISKRDATTSNELPGAELTLKNSNGDVVVSWTSTSSPKKIENLADGTYTLTEVTAPKGYRVAESITFKVENGTVSGGTVVMLDKRKSSGGSGGGGSSTTDYHAVVTDWYIDISKQDITTKTELPGAKLTVTKDGNTIDSWTSTTEPHKMKNLADGTYVLTEVTAPDGYEVAESITFTITNKTLDGGGKTVTMYDAPKAATTPAPTPTQDKPTPTPTTTLPKTGNTAAAAVITAASMLCIALIYTKKRKVI